MADYLDCASERCAGAGVGERWAKCTDERCAGAGVGERGARCTGERCANCVGKRCASAGGVASGLQLHRALGEALEPGAPLSDHYRHHPWRGDGGYLRALLAACRGGCARLPAYTPAVRARAVHAARLAQVLGLNHEPDPAARDAALAAWAGRHARAWGELEWFESTAAASGWLTVLALLALAAAGEAGERRAQAVYAAYLPWISLAGTMLDSYADRAQDVGEGEHSYVAHYPRPLQDARRVGELVSAATWRARALPDGARHAVVVACMTAMYLSKESARAPPARASTRRLARAGGSLTVALLPVLRAWRVVYAQRDE
jgi:tetraprenyl-beta-curcumene synthase